MKKAIKYILIIALIICVVFIGFTLRKFLIIHKIENNLEEISKKTNYCLKCSFENENNEFIYRRLNDMRMVSDSHLIVVTLSNNETYQFQKNEKYNEENDLIEYYKFYMKQDKEPFGVYDIYEMMMTKYFYNDPTENKNERDNIEQLKLALKCNIKTDELDGNECYAISYKVYDSTCTLYVSKDSLLLQKRHSKGNNGDEQIIISNLEFDTQTEADFAIDDLLEEYTEIIPQK